MSAVDRAAAVRPSEIVTSGSVFAGSSRDGSFEIDAGAMRVVTAYDANGDGAIELPSSGPGWASWGEAANDSGASVSRLVIAADRAGNRDGRATAAEIAEVMRRFDQSRTRGIEVRVGPLTVSLGRSTSPPDGRISGAELDAFLKRFGQGFAPSPRPQPDDYALLLGRATTHPAWTPAA